MSNFTNTSNISLVRIRDEMRMRYNPLRNLTPQRIAAAMDNFRCGYLSDASKIYDAIRRRDGVVQACVQKRKRATSRLEWTIVEQGDDSKSSAEHAKFLENLFNNIKITSAADANKIGSMSMLIENILSALENQYSVSEIIWDASNAPELSAEIRYVPLWFFENTEGVLKFKKSSFDTTGEDLENNGWLIAVNDSPLMEATAICYIIKRYAQADWAVFSERFGSATPVLNTGAAKNSDEWHNAIERLSQLANNCGIVLGKDEVFDLKQANGTGAPFKELIEAMDRYIALIWRGSDLSTLSADNAAGASLQADESEILEDSDCAMVEETIEHYIVRPAIEWRFGKGVKPCAYFQLTRKDRKDKLNQIAVFKGAAELGCPPAKRDVYEALDLREPEADEAIAELSTSTMATNTFANESSNSLQSALNEIAKAKGKDIQPFLDELDALEKITDVNEYAERLAEVEAKIFALSSSGKNEAEAMLKIVKENLTKQ